MNELKKSILEMQNDLNSRLYTTGPKGCKKQPIYELSTQLDREIARYYKLLASN